MLALWEKLVEWNKQMKGLPRKLALIACVLITCMIFIAIFPYCWPFVLALAFAVIMEPLVKLLCRLLGKLPAGKNLATIISMAVLFGLIGYLSFAVAGRLVTELVSLAKAAPGIIAELTTYITGWVRELYANFAYMLPDNFMSMVDTALSELGKTAVNFVTSISGTVASGAFATAFNLPGILLAVVLCIMGTYYMSADRKRIFTYLNKTFPEGLVNWARELKNGIIRALFGQIKSQILVSVLVTLTLMLGMLLRNEPYWLLIGLGIGIADMLPIVGAGLFLIPWSIIGFVLGDVTMGVSIAILYVAVIVVRQVFEPRIVGKNLGLYPLATMMAIFAGFKYLGVVGMLVGPIILNICRVVVHADSAKNAQEPLRKVRKPVRVKDKKET